MGMRKTQEAQKASDQKLRARIESGDTKNITTSTNKQRSEVFRQGRGKGGRGKG